MDKIDNMINILREYKLGKIIQYYDEGAKCWLRAMNPNWDFNKYVYRVKPEPKYKPIENPDEFTKEQAKHGFYIRNKGNKYIPVSLTPKGIIVLCFPGIKIDYKFYNYKDLVSSIFSWEDGTPCGILEE